MSLELAILPNANFVIEGYVNGSVLDDGYIRPAFLRR